MSMEKGIAMAIGIVVGLVFCVGIFKFANRDSKLKTEYDERQQSIRGKAYMYAFYTLVSYEAILGCLSVSDLLVLPIEDYIYHFFGIIVAGTVLCVYSVLNGAYWGINNNLERYKRIFILLFIINALPVVFSIKDGIHMENGIIDFPFMNLICVIFMIIIGITMLVKKKIDNSSLED